MVDGLQCVMIAFEGRGVIGVMWAEVYPGGRMLGLLGVIDVMFVVVQSSVVS